MSHRARTARRLYAVAGAVLLVTGLIVIVIAVRAQRSAPQPPASAGSFVPVTPSGTASGTSGTPPDTASGTASAASPDASSSGTGRARGPVLARSVPTHLDIPAIGVHTPLQQLGLNRDGTVQVPPLSRDSHAGWYKYSPTPGQLGPSVILGHIDSAAYGPGVFFELGALRQRDRVSVTLADHTVAEFRVEKVVEYRKASFPTLAVYGNTDSAALRLITCGGTFDRAAHSYESNIVVYAALVGSHRA